MQMTDGEILCSFNQAKDPPAQVQILADLNDCDVKTIKSILTAQGVDPRRLTRERQKTAPQQKPAKPVRQLSILQHLIQEREKLDCREKEIKTLLPQLQAEREIICKKREALSAAYVLLAEVYEEGKK